MRIDCIRVAANSFVTFINYNVVALIKQPGCRHASNAGAHDARPGATDRARPQLEAAGADAILLIAAILTDHQMNEMIEVARSYSLEVLLEIHDEEELNRTLGLDRAPDAVGINNRNLNTFEVSLETTARLADALPKEICRVSESGFATRSDLHRFEGIVDAFLIGESLMRSQDPEVTLRGWVKG